MKVNRIMEEKLLLSAIEAAKMCGIGRSLWYQLYKYNKCPQPIKLGNRTLWEKEKLRLWIKFECPNAKVLETKIKSMHKKQSKERVKELANTYVKTILTARSPLQHKDIPPILVEAKKEHLKLKQQIKKEQNNENDERSKR